MRFSLKRTVDPVKYPVTVEELKLHTHISFTDEDDLLLSWIKSGTEIAEDYLRRSLITQTWRLSFDYWPRFPVTLLRGPVQSLTSITYYDTDNSSSVWDSSNYILDTDADPGLVSLGYAVTLPSAVLRPANAVQFLYVAGYGATGYSVPENYKDAIMLYCAWRYENRTAETGSVPRHFYDLLGPRSLFDDASGA